MKLQFCLCNQQYITEMCLLIGGELNKVTEHLDKDIMLFENGLASNLS
jgi:hypothetical protein